MANLFPDLKSENLFIFKNEKMNIELWLKREDLLHPEISGNKYRKLKYNLLNASQNGYRTILTFGGAFSNHIAATAAAGKHCNINTVGIIRGEELGLNLDNTLKQNPTLKFAVNAGMKLHFISRTEYKEKYSEPLLFQLEKNFGAYYLVPEGGTNELAVKGCEEILTAGDSIFNYICCPVGTGGTISGIINASLPHQQVFGFPALKGDFLFSEIEKFTKKNNWQLITDYHFGGYAKLNRELVEFINFFKLKNKVQLDPVYTGKMLYGIMDMVDKGKFPQNTRILAIHTGGIQGISGMNNLLKSKKWPLIEEG